MMTMEQMVAGLERMKDDMPQIMAGILVSEASQAVRVAKMIAVQKGKVKTGRYMNGFAYGNAEKGVAGAPVKISGGSCEIDVFNNVPYAGRLEFGNESVPGTYALRSGISMMQQEQQGRMQKQLGNLLAGYIEGGGKNGD